MINKEITAERLKNHLKALTVDIGERSILYPDKLKKTEQYIVSFYKKHGINVQVEPYKYRGITAANITGKLSFSETPTENYILGAHYDSVAGTAGADDNASSVAVQLETARILKSLKRSHKADISIRFVSFALEEPPAYGTRYMGSRVYAKKAKRNKERIDGMICLEMVGFTCNEKGCQKYPFPVNLFGYPKTGNFIGIVGDLKSREFARSVYASFLRNKELPVINLNIPLKGLLLPSVRLSDHASFWDAGYRAVMITDTSFYRNPHYHLRSDTMETLDYNFMASLVESLVEFFINR